MLQNYKTLIRFADDTNLFYVGKDFHFLFNNVNNEFNNISAISQ